MTAPHAAFLPDEMLLAEAAKRAAAQHLHLVITRDGRRVLTPVLLPGMQKIAVQVEQPNKAAA